MRYVRNITDVGHLEHDADEGEDKIQLEKARLEQLEPMEIAQYYTNRYHQHYGCAERAAPFPSNLMLQVISSSSSNWYSRFWTMVLVSRNEWPPSISNIEAYNKKSIYGILEGRSLGGIFGDESRELAGVFGEKKNQLTLLRW